MIKILTALGNPVLNNELNRYEKYEVLSEDLFYQDALLDNLETKDADTIIVSGLLQGQYDIVDFLRMVRERSINSRIILIVDTIDDESKKKLMDINIYDIMFDDKIEVRDVIEAIDREEPIIKKAQMTISEDSDILYDASPLSKNTELKPTIQKQEIIAISGTPGSGKTTVAVNLAKVLSKKSNAKILLIDLDTLYGNLDELLDINKIPQNVEIIIDNDKRCGLNYITDLINKNRFDMNVLDEIVIPCGKFDVITGNTSLHFCQNVLNEEIYQKILDTAKEKYDFIIIDTSSNIFLDSTKWALKEANRVLFVTENSYVCVKKAMQMFDVFKNIWGIWKGKFELVINKICTNGLESELVSNILDSLSVIGEIKIQEQNKELSYEEILRKINYIPKLTILKRFLQIKQNMLDGINLQESNFNLKGEKYAN